MALTWILKWLNLHYSRFVKGSIENLRANLSSWRIQIYIKLLGSDTTSNLFIHNDRNIWRERKIIHLKYFTSTNKVHLKIISKWLNFQAQATNNFCNLASCIILRHHKADKLFKSDCFFRNGSDWCSLLFQVSCTFLYTIPFKCILQ